jgi:hypothetical protein
MDRMQDVLFVAIIVGFFGLSAAYVRGCDRLMGPLEERKSHE